MNPKKRGLNKHDVREIAHAFEVKHTPACRDNSPKGSGPYECVCDWATRIEAKIMAVAFDGATGWSLESYQEGRRASGWAP